MRQIQRFVVEPQSAQCVRGPDEGVEGEGEKGSARVGREVLGEVGCEERRVWE